MIRGSDQIVQLWRSGPGLNLSPSSPGSRSSLGEGTMKQGSMPTALVQPQMSWSAIEQIGGSNAFSR